MSELVSSGPSYLLHYWRPWNENSDAFDSFMDYTKDMSLANYTASAIGSYVQQASADQVDAINNMANELGFSLDLMSTQLDDLNIKTEQTNRELQFLNFRTEQTNRELQFLNRNMDVQIEQQRLSNLLLKNITELLRVPDSEKERQHSIEWGIKFMVNAQKDPDLFKDALEELHKAEELRKQDYFVLHRLGMIYLYATNFMNPGKALHYFETAAKYASVESDPGAMRLANILTSSNDDSSTDSIQQVAADSFEKAALAAYVLGRFDVAVKHQTKAHRLSGTTQNKFLLAKYSVRTGDVDSAIKHLEDIIKSKPALFDGVFRDFDLMNEPKVLKFLKTKSDELNLNIYRLIKDAELLEGDVKSVYAGELDAIASELYEKRVQINDDLHNLNEEVIVLNRQIDEMVGKAMTHVHSKSNVFLDSIEELKKLDYTSKKVMNDAVAIALKTIKTISKKRAINFLHYREVLLKSNELWGWASDNLGVSTFRNGDPIPEAKTDEEWVEAGKNEQPAWCWASNDPVKRKKYGKLYNHYAVADPRGLVPRGWRIPTEDELEVLIVDDQLTDKINLPMAGRRDIDDGSLSSVGSRGSYWSSSVDGARASYLYFYSGYADMFIDPRAYGYSVRCLLD